MPIDLGAKKGSLGGAGYSICAMKPPFGVGFLQVATPSYFLISLLRRPQDLLLGDFCWSDHLGLDPRRTVRPADRWSRPTGTRGADPQGPAVAAFGWCFSEVDTPSPTSTGGSSSEGQLGFWSDRSLRPRGVRGSDR